MLQPLPLSRRRDARASRLAPVPRARRGYQQTHRQPDRAPRNDPQDPSVVRPASFPGTAAAGPDRVGCSTPTRAHLKAPQGRRQGEISRQTGLLSPECTAGSGDQGWRTPGTARIAAPVAPAVLFAAVAPVVPAAAAPGAAAASDTFPRLACPAVPPERDLSCDLEMRPAYSCLLQMPGYRAMN